LPQKKDSAKIRADRKTQFETAKEALRTDETSKDAEEGGRQEEQDPRMDALREEYERKTTRPILTLGGEVLKYKEGETILGFPLTQAIQGGRAFVKKVKSKAAIATAKIEKIGIHNGNKTNLEATARLYESMLQSVITSNLTNPQLDTKDGDLPGYKAARQAVAPLLRRCLATSARTPPEGLAAESGFPLIDGPIIAAKLGLIGRMIKRAATEEAKTAKAPPGTELLHDATTTVLLGRIKDVCDGDTRGLCAETKRIWEEANEGHKWPPIPGTNGKHLSKTQNKATAKKVAETRWNNGSKREQRRTGTYRTTNCSTGRPGGSETAQSAK
jgi:hypothetical protein